jgi:tripartite-type tricarboxylate transporter receptor subunit TctC
MIRRIAALAVLLLSLPLCAQDWPSRPVTLVVAFAPGGTVDIVARTLAQRLTADTGQSFVVDNRGGAAGTIATALVARATPDGHTLLFHHMGLAFNATLYHGLPFDTRKDIVPVAYIGATPNVLVVNKSLPIHTVKEFLDYARAHPGAINYGSGGIGSAGHLPMELLQSMTNVQLTHVPYKGSGPALTDLLGGRIQAMLLTIPAVMPLIAADSVRAIATSGRRRSPALPDLPTLAESGIEGFDYAPWYAVFAPAGTPPAIVQKAHDAVNRAIEDPQIRAKLGSQGLEVQPMSREEFAGIVQADIAKWSRIIAKLGIHAD